MTTVIDAPLVKYPITAEQIATLREQYSGLKADSKEGYEEVRLAIGDLREKRVAVEKRRKELKEDSLEWGRKVDAVAKHLTNELESIENPLKLTKGEWDERKAKEKAAKEAEERAKVEAEIRAKREAEESQLRAKREAEESKLREEQAKLKAEQEKLAQHQAKLKAEREAIEKAQRIEREKIEAEKRELEAKRQAAERTEFERQARIKAEAEARAKVERERIAAEERQKARLAREEEDRRRLEEMRPDVEKVHIFAEALRQVRCSELQSPTAKIVILRAYDAITLIVEHLEAFDGSEEPLEEEEETRLAGLPY
jgi:chromosome segregation ATPase